MPPLPASASQAGILPWPESEQFHCRRSESEDEEVASLVDIDTSEWGGGVAPADGGWHPATPKNASFGICKSWRWAGSKGGRAERADAEEGVATDATSKLGAEKECRSNLSGTEPPGCRAEGRRGRNNQSARAGNNVHSKRKVYYNIHIELVVSFIFFYNHNLNLK